MCEERRGRGEGFPVGGLCTYWLWELGVWCEHAREAATCSHFISGVAVLVGDIVLTPVLELLAYVSIWRIPVRL